MRKLLFTFILVVFTSSELRAGLVYQLIDLGTLGGTVSVANGINNQGEVVGYSYNQGSAMARAFRYSEEMSDLGLQSSGIAQAINSASQVTGQTSFQNGTRGFIKSGANTILISTFGGNYSAAYAINSFGLVAGFASTQAEIRQAMITGGSVPNSLGSLGGQNSVAYDLTDDLFVVGEAQNAQGNFRAFRYHAGSMIDLGTLGGSQSAAFAINSNAQIVGSSQIFNSQSRHAFKHSGNMIDLGTLGGSESAAYDINSNGDVVGFASVPSGETHAFVHMGGTMHDLNEMLDASGEGWVLTEARAMNDDGKIVGYGRTPTGQYHGFLLSPIPEPSSAALLLLAFAGLLLGLRPAGAIHAAPYCAV